MFGTSDAMLPMKMYLHRRATMKISSADVKSLLVRLHDEIQVEVGKNATTNQGLFAQSLEENLVGASTPATTKEAETARESNFIAVVPRGKTVSVSPVFDGGASTDVSPNNELGLAKHVERPSVEFLPVQKGTKTEARKAGLEDGLSVQKSSDKSIAPLDALKGKPGVEKRNKVRQKRDAAEIATSANLEPSVVPRTAVVDPSAQAPNTEGLVSGPSLAPQPALANAADGEMAGKKLLMESPSIKTSGNRPVHQSTTQSAKSLANVQEGRKSSGLVTNADKADSKDEISKTTDEGALAQTSTTSEREKLSSVVKAVDANESIRAAADVISAPTALQPPVTQHVASPGRDSSSAYVIATATQDSGTMDPSHGAVQDHRILNATASTIEVGIASGSHGWLKVRAEMTDTGAIKAAISSATSTGQEMLHRDLPLLSSFLEQERIPVNSLTVHQTPPSNGFDSGGNTGGGTAGQQSREENAGDQNRPQNFGSVKNIVVPDGLIDMRLEDLAASNGLIGGGWLNVRA
jgi:hypothetical protein